MSASEYWLECIGQACDEINLTLTAEQMESLAEAAQNGHEMFSESHGYLDIPNPLRMENEALQRKLKREQESTVCPACGGSGSITENLGPINRSCTSRCDKCSGAGRIYYSRP